MKVLFDHIDRQKLADKVLKLKDCCPKRSNISHLHGTLEELDILAHAAETELSRQNVADKRSPDAMTFETSEVHQAPVSTDLTVQGKTSVSAETCIR